MSAEQLTEQQQERLDAFVRSITKVPHNTEKCEHMGIPYSVMLECLEVGVPGKLILEAADKADDLRPEF